MATTPDSTSTTADCIYCGDAFPAARAEIGYAYCMKAECRERGVADKGSAPIEVVFTEADTSRF